MSRPPASAGATFLSPDAEPLPNNYEPRARHAAKAADRRHLRALVDHHGPAPLTPAGWVALKQ